MTVYTSPVYWWFGDPLEGFGLRWNLMGAVFFALACLVDRRKFPIDWSNKVMPIIGCYFLFCLNATIVHFTLADNVERSAYGLQLAWKQLILLTCLLVSLRDRFDVKLFAMAIASLSAYVAYEIIFKDAGTYDDGRLNKISIPQAVGSNELAGIFCTESHVLLCA